MDSIDVNVKAEPSSCRDLAAWLEKLSEANQKAATATIKASSSSEAYWQGQAGDAFRDQMSRSGQDIDELVQAIDRASSGLKLFADDIDTVRQRMDQCLQLAHQAGLTVTGTVIHRPPGGPADRAPDGVGGNMPGLDPKARAHAEAERKLEAWHEIESTVDDARRLERTAHRSLNKALGASNTVVDAVLASPLTWISRGLVYAGAAHGAATTLSQLAETQFRFADEYARLAADSALPAATRQANLAKLLTSAGMTAQQAESNARLLANLGKTPAGDHVFRLLTPTLGGKGEGVLRGIGKAFPVVSVLAAGGFTGIDIANGKPVGKAIWANFGGLAASTGAASLVAAGAAGGGVTVAGLGVGFTVATAWGYFQENDLRDLYRDLGGDGIDGPNDNSDEYRKGRFGW
jgi:uncharacterized protein YukE